MSKSAHVYPFGMEVITRVSVFKSTRYTYLLMSNGKVFIDDHVNKNYSMWVASTNYINLFKVR